MGFLDPGDLKRAEERMFLERYQVLCQQLAIELSHPIGLPQLGDKHLMFDASSTG